MAQRYDLMVPRSGNDGKTYWTKVGVAFANKSGNGFNLTFEALPLPSKNDKGEYETRVIMMEPRPRRMVQIAAATTRCRSNVGVVKTAAGGCGSARPAERAVYADRGRVYC